MSFFKDLFGHNEAQNAHKQVYGNDGDYNDNFGENDFQDGGQREHQSSFTHEAIAGAAGFAGMFRNIYLSNCTLKVHMFFYPHSSTKSLRRSRPSFR